MLLSLVCFPVFSQQPATKDVIYLKNGEKYIGDIVLKTEQIVMLQTSDGKRYQFQITDIKELRQENVKPDEKVGTVYESRGNFAGLIQLNGGISSIKGSTETSPFAGVSLAFGARKVFKKPIFLGAGAGYENIFDSKNSRNIGFIPVFVQMKNNYSDKAFSPASNLKIGYALPLQKEYSGGLFFHVSGGISYMITPESSVFAGLYFQAQQTYGNVTETLSQGAFTSKSNAILTTFGVSTAFIF